jgi:hypothetical protein
MHAKTVVVEPDATARHIRNYIRDHPSIRKDQYDDPDTALQGSCYVAAEAYFHATGDTDSGLDIHCLSWSDVDPTYEASHWFLSDADRIIDLSLPTPEHGETVPWSAAQTRAFITGYDPSTRTQRVLDALHIAV